MFSKNLEFAFQQLMAANTSINPPVIPVVINNGTINIDSADVQNAIAWAYQIAAFIYLGGGIAFTFFGAKLVQLLISGLAGLLAAAIPIYFTQTIYGAIGGLIIFGIVAHQMYHKERFHAVVLGIAVGSYVGSFIWALLLSQFTTVYVRYTLQIVGAIVFGFVGHQHKDKHGHADYKEKSALLSSFVGANMIATSITLFTADSLGLWGNLGIQLGCIVVFMFLGHKFQDAIGIGGEHHKEPRDDHFQAQTHHEENHHHDRL
jgi:uncharacterized protein YcfJ